MKYSIKHYPVVFVVFVSLCMFPDLSNTHLWPFLVVSDVDTALVLFILEFTVHIGDPTC